MSLRLLNEIYRAQVRLMTLPARAEHVFDDTRTLRERFMTIRILAGCAETTCTFKNSHCFVEGHAYKVLHFLPIFRINVCFLKY